MVSTSRRMTALIILGVFFMAAISISCLPKKLPTSEPGRSGLPTGAYDPGTPPPPWEIELKKLPIYPESKQFGTKYTFLTTDPIRDVALYYKEKLPDAELVEPTEDNPVVIFKTDMYILEIELDEGKENTLITFKEPEK